MGLFDTYSANFSLQLKVGDPGLMNYKVGDDANIPDGIYLASGNDGFVVIHGGKLMATYKTICDTMGVAFQSDLLELSPFEKDLIRTMREMDMRKEYNQKQIIGLLHEEWEERTRQSEKLMKHIDQIKALSSIGKDMRKHVCHCHTGCDCAEGQTGECDEKEAKE